MWWAGRIRQTALLTTMILQRFITCCISQNILSEKGKENKISLLKILDIHAIITVMMYLVKITCREKENRQRLDIFFLGFAKNTMMQGGLHCAEKSSRKKR